MNVENPSRSTSAPALLRDLPREVDRETQRVVQEERVATR